MRLSNSKSVLLTVCLLVAANFAQLVHGTIAGSLPQTYAGGYSGGYSGGYNGGYGGAYGGGYGGYGGGYPYNKMAGAHLYPADTSYNVYSSLGVFSYNSPTSALYGSEGSVCPSAPVKIDNDLTLICCNKRPVLTLLSPEQAKCCGEVVYDPNLAVCCGNSVTYFTGGQVLGCCGSSSYDRKAQVCCGGKLFTAQYGAKSACCGVPKYASYAENSPYQYDVTTQFCCNSALHNLTEVFLKPIDTVLGELGDDIASKVGCCKDDAYYTKTQKCCGDKINDISLTPNAVCCRSDIIDPTKQICCNGFVYNDVYSKCCGVNAYDPKTAKCCGGYPSPSAGGEYDPNYSCCGILSYNTQTQMCCSGVIINTPSYNKKCCGYKPYDKTASICCDEEFVVNKGASCYESSVPYSADNAPY